MKKLIILIIVVLLIWGALKIIGVDTSVSLNLGSKEKNSRKKLTADYVIAEYMEGISFPKGATDVHVDQWSAGYYPLLEQSFWVVAKMSQEDLYGLIDQLKLIAKPDLLEFWPEAFKLEQGGISSFWNITNTTNEDTYYGQHPKNERSIAIKYENKKAYIRTLLVYIQVEDENGQKSYIDKKRQAD